MTKISTIIIFLSSFSTTQQVYGFISPVSLPTQNYPEFTVKSKVFREEQPYPSIVRKAKSTTTSTTGLFVANQIDDERKKEDEEKEEALSSNNMGLAGVVAILYTNYLKRLWRETAPKERRRIASKRASNAINDVKHLMEGEEYMDFNIRKDDETLDAYNERVNAKDQLLEACNSMLRFVDNNEVETLTPKDNTSASAKPKKKKTRSVWFGAAMGAVVACWVFSGNYIFTGLFTLMTALGQLEFYRMVMNTGIYPARKISVVGACAMFITALLAPKLHQLCLPIFATWTMLWFLTMRRKVTTIAEIATTFTGIFYLGYLPSYWVRLRTIGGGLEPTRLAPIVRPMLEFLGAKSTKLPSYLPKSVHLPITTGAIFLFWSWISIAFSDVGAYFVGKKFGKNKLGDVAPAAGAASPNKTIEGFFGGIAVCAMFTTTGAWVQRWPYWFVTGPLHGVMLASLGLLGDLTASVLKRDAGLKDFGDFIPEHGGIMDRVDSYVFTAPYSWVVCRYIIPALKLKTRVVP